MESPKSTYMRLIKQYLWSAITGDELQSRYFRRFKSENRPMSEELFKLLDTIFADLDSYVPDEEGLAELRKDEPRPGWCLSDGDLRSRLEEYATRLARIRR